MSLFRNLNVASKNMHASGRAEENQSLRIKVTFTISEDDRVMTPARVYQTMSDFVQRIRYPPTQLSTTTA